MPSPTAGNRLRRHAAWLTIAAMMMAMTPAVAANDKPGKRKPPPHLVQVTDVTLQSVGSETEVLGSLRHRRTVRVFNQEEGRVSALPFFEGDLVRKGQTLVEFDQTLLRAQLAKALATRKQAKLDLDRQLGLAKRKLSTEDATTRARTAMEIARAEETVLRTRIGYAVIKAPFAGIITARKVEPGDAVAKHTQLLTLADPASLITELAVSELLLPDLRVGDPVTITVDAIGHTPLSGRINRIHPEIDPNTRTGILEAELSPVPEKARAGQFVRVHLETRKAERLLISFAAIRRDREGEYVFRVTNDSEVERVPVTTGLRFGDRVAILDGLRVGDPIVLRGFLGLRHGKRVKLAEAGG